MKQTTYIIAAIVLCIASGCTGLQTPTDPSIASSQEEVETWRSFVGTWQALLGVKTIVFSIHDDGQVLVLYMRPGQHTIKHVKWEPYHGGILILDATRYRLWRGSNDQAIRVEADHNPNQDLDELEFPVRFFMGKIRERKWPDRMLNRPLLESWKQQTLDASWDETAGRRAPD